MSVSVMKRLTRHGLTSEFYADTGPAAAKNSGDLIAYCTSLDCSGKRGSRSEKHRAKRGMKECPDCGWALFWKRG